MIGSVWIPGNPFMYHGIREWLWTTSRRPRLPAGIREQEEHSQTARDKEKPGNLGLSRGGQTGGKTRHGDPGSPPVSTRGGLGLIRSRVKGALCA